MPSTPLIRFKKEQQRKKEGATKETGVLVQVVAVAWMRLGAGAGSMRH